MYNLDTMPLRQLTGYAGTDYDKLIGLVNAYVKANCLAYTASVSEPTFVEKQQVVVALGRSLVEALMQVTMKP